ncbi:MAG: ABC transporter permease [Spirochaetes bacterium]|nr:ABC transporter permease [Spirochaetota bacterium]
MKEIVAIIRKELLLLIRDPGSLIMLFVLPAIFILILSIALQGAFSTANEKEKMDLIIVNHDSGNTGNEIMTGLEKSGFFHIIEEIDHQKITNDQAKSLIDKGKYKIAVLIPEQTTKAINFQEKASIAIYVDPILSSEFAANITSSIQNLVNVTIIRNIATISYNIFDEINRERIDQINHQIISTQTKKQELLEKVNDIMESGLEEESKAVVQFLTDENIEELNSKIKELNKQKDTFNLTANKNEELVRNKYHIGNDAQGLKVEQIFYSQRTVGKIPNSVQQNVPGWTIFALFWIVQIIAMTFILERKSGAFRRILIAPINKVQYIIGKTIPFFIINLIQAVFMFLIGIYVLPLFGCPMLELTNLPAIVLLTISASVTAISMGLLISVITDSMFLAMSLAASLLIILTVMAGIMVPRFIMPLFMQKLSFLIPQGWALDAYLNIFVREAELITILPNIGVLWGFSSIFFFIALWRFNVISSIDK